MKIKQKVMIIVVILATFSCISPRPEANNNNSSNHEKEYFEGIIEYSIHYERISTSISEEKLKEFLGTKIVRSFRKGSWREDYYNSQEKWVRTSILNQKEKRYYYEMVGNDTVFYSEIDETNYETSIEQLSDTILNNHPCWTVKSISHHKGNESDIVSAVYYISKQYKLNPEWYLNYIDGGHDRIYKIAPGLEYQTKYSNSNFTQVRRLVSQKRNEINDTEFDIDPTKPIKKTRY